MNVLTMSKADIRNLKYSIKNRKWNEMITCDSIILVPNKHIHDSGFMCMDIIALNENREPICYCEQGSDALHLDGIGGYGLNWKRDIGIRTEVPIANWTIDCLPSGFLRLFCSKKIIIGDGLSDLSIYREGV